MTTELYTTGKLARSAGSDLHCDAFRMVFDSVGGETYGWETPVLLSKVLEVAGLDAALWALRCVPPEQEADRDRIARLFACDAAESVLHIFERQRPDDRRPREAIRIARRFANGQATRQELDAAGAAAWAAAGDAAWAAAGDAAWAAAGDAARAELAEIFLSHLKADTPQPETAAAGATA
jgi:hypothetical protein